VTSDRPRLVARPPAAGVDVPVAEEDPDVVVAYLEDASGRPPGRASGLVRPADPAQVAAWLGSTAARGVRVLPQAARSSLTGGAVPDGDVVLSVERLRSLGPVERHGDGARVRVGAGVRLSELQAELTAQGWYFPPVPTYQEAMVGGAVSTNAGGAATFKYGTVRSWVRGLTVALADGSTVRLERGEAQVPRGAAFDLVTGHGSVRRCPTPDWTLPDLPKISAGYHAADPLDLVDLFVGSEGTLGVVLDATLDLAPAPPAVLTAVAFVGNRSAAIRLAGVLRSVAIAHRHASGDGPDVRAIEIVDDRGLALLREHGDLGRLRVDVPVDAGSALLLEIELPTRCSAEVALEELDAWLGDRRTDAPATLAGALRALFGILDDASALDSLQIAFPDDAARREALVGFREAVPTRVNELLALRRRDDPGVRKVGGDLVVPFEHLDPMMEIYAAEFERRGLEYAVWGHVSDGNLHPNALARTTDDVRSGEQALLAFADEAIRRGGSPLSEHGVGRSTLKQEMLRRFLGDAAIERMRAIKRALDPGHRLAPGVLVPGGAGGARPGEFEPSM
jgi:D-lactate dehydrogenase (cytochrome)